MAKDLSGRQPAYPGRPLQSPKEKARAHPDWRRGDAPRGPAQTVPPLRQGKAGPTIPGNIRREDVQLARADGHREVPALLPPEEERPHPGQATERPEKEAHHR